MVTEREFGLYMESKIPNGMLNEYLDNAARMTGLKKEKILEIIRDFRILWSKYGDGDPLEK